MAQYSTLQEANDYFELVRLFGGKWATKSPADRNKALVEAALMIDKLQFAGVKAVETQELKFPRGTDTVVPDDIKTASNEIAFELLVNEVDLEFESRNLTVGSEGYSTVRTTYDRSIEVEHLANGIPSVKAWRCIRPFLRDIDGVLLSRVS